MTCILCESTFVPLTYPHENRIISISNDLINHPVALLTLSLSVLACSGWSHAHLQRSRSHRHHRVWHPRPRSDVGTATKERGVICHPQPPSACQDGRRVQGLWEHVWSHARHLPRNFRCVFLYSSSSSVYFKCQYKARFCGLSLTKVNKKKCLTW